MSHLQHTKGDVRIYGVPGHAGLQGYEGVNQLARDTALRAPCNRSQPQEPTPPTPITFQDLRGKLYSFIQCDACFYLALYTGFDDLHLYYLYTEFLNIYNQIFNFINLFI